MPKIKYENKNFRATSLALIEKANEIVADYEAQGYSLTLRQLYYQMVSKNLIPNTPKSYDNLGSLINDARYAGLIDWEALEDRTRHLRELSAWKTPEAIIESAAQSYHNDLWRGQEVYCEVWIEKDALVGVIEGICNELDVPHFSCRGYTSATEMWNAAMRLIRKCRGNEGTHRRVVILHLGDHDPSGLDMTRDIRDRLTLFSMMKVPIEVKRIALNRDQVDELGLPPNPAKITDSRAAAYIEEHGTESWELDALTPAYITDLIRNEILGVLDLELWEQRRDKQEKDRQILNKVSEKWEAVKEAVNGNDE